MLCNKCGILLASPSSFFFFSFLRLQSSTIVSLRNELLETKKKFPFYQQFNQHYLVSVIPLAYQALSKDQFHLEKEDFLVSPSPPDYFSATCSPSFCYFPFKPSFQLSFNDCTIVRFAVHFLYLPLERKLLPMGPVQFIAHSTALSKYLSND